MLKRIKSFFQRFKRPEHDRELFVVGQLAFVKCKRCGSESIPWVISKTKADQFRKDHPDNMELLKEIEKSPRDYRCIG